MALFRKLFFKYIQSVIRLYHGKWYTIGRDTVPDKDSLVIFVGNHRCCMMDPLDMVMTLEDRILRCFVRSDVFNVPKPVASALTWLGLIPLARSRYEKGGLVESRQKNNENFDRAIDLMERGDSVLIYPEGQHQILKRLAVFNNGYVWLAFRAAERNGFSREVNIVPFAHFYGNYFHPFHQYLTCFCEPFKLSAYYDRYMEKPRTTVAEVNDEIRDRVQEAMFHIDDEEHHTGLDQLICGPYGRKYAESCGLDPKHLPDRFASDKKLIRDIESAKSKFPEEMSALLDRLQRLETDLLSRNIRDWVVASRPGAANLIIRILLLTVLSPLAIASVITLPAKLVPGYIHRKTARLPEDILFRTTWQVGTLILLTIPVFWILVSLLLLAFAPVAAGAWFVAYPTLLLFSVWYRRFLKKTKGVYNYVTSDDRKALSAEREDIVNKLNQILKKI